MAEPGTTTPRPQARRFARLPHDSQVERASKEWAQDMSAYAAFELLWPEINRGANLAMGVFNKRSVATLTRLGEHPDQMCNAVSGWASTPGAAIVDLAFRWIVLCKESWVIANHVPLVSKVSQQ